VASPFYPQAGRGLRRDHWTAALRRVHHQRGRGRRTTSKATPITWSAFRR